MEDNEEFVVVEEGPVSSRAPTRRLLMRVQPPVAVDPVEPVLAEGSGPTQHPAVGRDAITRQLRVLRP